jgi:hypothetical protein
MAGEVNTSGKMESAITKFSINYAPTWTYRFPSTGMATVGSLNQALFISSGMIAQLNWSPRYRHRFCLPLIQKEHIMSADSGPAGQGEVIFWYQSQRKIGV